MGDGNTAFRLASNLKTAWLGSTCQYSLQDHRGTQASPQRQGSNNRGGFFWLLHSYFTNGGSLMCSPPGLKYLLTTKREADLVSGKIISKSWNVGNNDFCM